MFKKTTVYKLSDPELKEWLYSDKKKQNLVLEQIKRSSLWHNPTFRRKLYVYGLLVIILMMNTNPVFAATETAAKITEFAALERFINNIIHWIRIFSVSICSLISANVGLKILITEEIDAKKEFKKSAQNMLWALFLIFVGTTIAKLVVKNIIGI